MRPNDIYAFEAQDLKGKTVSLSDYKGKVILAVNTASRCAFTPQLEQLQALHERYESKGFVVLAFPSDDFGHQEPLAGKGLGEFCAVQRLTFPMFEKIHVKGAETHPLFRYFSDFGANGFRGIRPYWNFQKYLVNRKGKLVRTYLPITPPSAFWLAWDIERALKQGAK